MKALGITRYDGALEELDVPAPPRPGAGEVQVQVHAVSFNPVDGLIAQGYGAPLLNRRRRFPLLLGRDGVGIVVACGPDVTGLAPGQRVLFAVSPRTGGTYADRVNLPLRCVTAIGDGLPDELAAGIGYAGSTALQALVAARLTPSNARARTVCINGASGGVGAVAVQLAAAWGASVTAICSQRNHAWVESLGARQLIDYRNQAALATLRSNVVINAAPPTTPRQALNDPLASALKRNGSAPAYATLITPMLGMVSAAGLLPGLALGLGDYARRRAGFALHGAHYRWVLFEERPRALQELARFFETPGARSPVRTVRRSRDLPMMFSTADAPGRAGKTVFIW